ncbi:MAG: type II CAAX prenyl endopeptidase Rce1 family protein [Promethearchaeota archaeon]
MTINLGENSWILIILTCLEILFVIIPAFISSKIEKKRLKQVIGEMGFQKNEEIFIKVIAGLGFGILFFFLSIYLMVFIRDIIVKNIFGSQFVQEGQESAISTTPINPNILQLTILVSLQLIIIGPCEEAFFRGFLIKKLNQKLKITFSIIISSIFFAFFHVPLFIVPLTTIITYFGYYFSFGLLLATIFIYFDYSLIPCSIAHSSFNILLLIL